jgi:nucleotidyltransferase substrate binding protein (TIGR01987 family)
MEKRERILCFYQACFWISLFCYNVPMTSKERLNLRLALLQQALKRLGEAVTESQQRPESDTLRDGVIQRFEFTFELAWKVLKARLDFEGFPEANSPRAVIKQAFQLGWLSDEGAWLSLLDDRNQTSHTYDSATALVIYQRIVAQHLPLFLALQGVLGPLS